MRPRSYDEMAIRPTAEHRSSFFLPYLEANPSVQSSRSFGASDLNLITLLFTSCFQFAATEADPLRFYCQSIRDVFI
jgi:hypothetical protein